MLKNNPKSVEEMFEEMYAEFKRLNPHGTLLDWNDFIDEYVLPYIKPIKEDEN